MTDRKRGVAPADPMDRDPESRRSRVASPHGHTSSEARSPAPGGDAASSEGPVPNGLEGNGSEGNGSGGDGPAGGRMLDEDSQSGIERQLRSFFDEVASEPVPPRFLDLLNDLERAESRGRPKANDR